MTTVIVQHAAGWMIANAEAKNCERERARAAIAKHAPAKAGGKG